MFVRLTVSGKYSCKDRLRFVEGKSRASDESLQERAVAVIVCIIRHSVLSTTATQSLWTAGNGFVHYFTYSMLLAFFEEGQDLADASRALALSQAASATFAQPTLRVHNRSGASSLSPF